MVKGIVRDLGGYKQMNPAYCSQGAVLTGTCRQHVQQGMDHRKPHGDDGNEDQTGMQGTLRQGHRGRKAPDLLGVCVLNPRQDRLFLLNLCALRCAQCTPCHALV